jgi:hypothetical protein
MRGWAVCGAAALWVCGLAAQVTVGPPEAPARPQQLVVFNPSLVVLHRDEGQWQLREGQRVLKQFASEADAREALRLVRELRLSAHGQIGTPRPVMEYWLADGRAPENGFAEPQTVPFDPRKLRVEGLGGQYFLRDDEVFLFNFGPHRADADQARVVLMRYGFNRVGYVGQPPTLIYFLLSRQERARPSAKPKDRSRPAADDNLLQLARLQTRQLAPASLPLPEPDMDGQVVPLQPERIELRRQQQAWQLVLDDYCLARFGGSEGEARTALQIVQRYGFTEHCQVGMPASFTFFLVNGQAPRGLPFAVRSTRFRPEALSVRGGADGWAVADGTWPLFHFRRGDDARNALRLIQKYQFDHVCHVGPNDAGLTFLVRSF